MKISNLIFCILFYTYVPTYLSGQCANNSDGCRDSKYQTAWGPHALELMNGGIGAHQVSFNTAFGAYAGQNIGADDEAHHNTVVGYRAGYGYKYTNGMAEAIKGHNTIVGSLAGQNCVSANNSLLGYKAGAEIEGNNNVIVGTGAAETLDQGSWNTIIGDQAAKYSTTLDGNVFIGDATGQLNNGIRNVFVGSGAGFDNNATRNTFIGAEAGKENTGEKNVFLGTEAGSENKGSRNVIIGQRADLHTNKTASDILFIDNRITDTPLIYGEFDNNFLKFHGDVDVQGLLSVQGSNNFSSRAHKANHEEIDYDSILESVTHLSIEQWNYKERDTAHHIGPYAEDFYRLFQLGEENTISTIDANGVAMVSIKAINNKFCNIESKLEQAKNLINKL